MATSAKQKQSQIEKSIAAKLRKLKPKHQQTGYLRRYALENFDLIESTLSRGCDYADIAEVIAAEIGRDVSSNTLKKYHQANREALQQKGNLDASNGEENESKQDFRTDSVESEGNEFGLTRADKKRGLTVSDAEEKPPNVLSSQASATSSLKEKLSTSQSLNGNLDEDEMEGFNVY